MANIENLAVPEAGNEKTIQRIAIEVIEPALQKALGEARRVGSPEEVINALANCYGGLLVDLMGREAAVTSLLAHAEHIASHEEPPLNS